MKRLLQFSILSLFSILLLSACSGEDDDSSSITMYKNEGCQCCTKWADYMRENGYEVEEKAVDNLSAMKFNYKIPNDLGACHTSVIGDYVVEGHVPVEDIERLMEEQPDAKGIGVGGMPIGSPGMEQPGRTAESYDVMLFQEDGSQEVFSSH